MNTYFFLRATLASALLIVGFDALASGTKDNPCDDENLSNCLDGVSGAVTAFDAVRVAFPKIKTRSSSNGEDETALNNISSGLAAGSLTGNYNIWANASYSEFESTFVIGSYEAERTGLLIGVDRMIGAKSVLGVAFGYEDLSTTTFYNGGSDSEDGFTIAPYYGVALTDTLTFDMSVGYSWLDHNQNRLRADGNRLFASYDADRLFGSINLSNAYVHSKLRMEANVGLNHAEENHDGYTETGPSPRTVRDRTISITQAELGFGVSQTYNNVTPYASIAFRKDLDSDEDAAAGGLPAGVIAHGDDDTEVEFIIGADIATRENIDISFSFNKLFSRDDFDKWGLDLSLRMPL
jgi:uncharacterized protein YhjY with autotransporter beta-barrel domain